MVTYCKLRTGEWGVKGEGLHTGERVKVTLKSGKVKEEMVDKIIFTKGEFAIATIHSVRAAEPQTETASKPSYRKETKHCWECGQVFTQDQCRDGNGDWSEGWCGC